MIIALYYIMVNTVLPTALTYVREIASAIMPLIILVVAIMILLSCIGLKVSANLGSTILGGLFRAIGFIVTQAWNLFRVIAREIWRLIPRVFRGTRRFLRNQGMNEGLSGLISGAVTVLVIAIII